MFDSISHESLPNGDTFAHFHASDVALFGYVGFGHTSRRISIKATIFHVGIKRVFNASYMARAPFAAWAQDFTATHC